MVTGLIAAQGVVDTFRRLREGGRTPESSATAAGAVTSDRFDIWSTRAQTRSARQFVRIEGADMRDSQRQRSLIRSHRRDQGLDPDGVAVIVGVSVVIADTVMHALALGACSEESGRRMRYVGTPGGLAGFIADVCVTGVADGVFLTPEPPRWRTEFDDRGVFCLPAGGAQDVSDGARRRIRRNHQRGDDE